MLLLFLHHTGNIMPVIILEKLQKELARLIISRRKELNIKQEDLSVLAKTGIRTIRDLEKGKGNPSLKTIETIMYVLGIEIEVRRK